MAAAAQQQAMNGRAAARARRQQQSRSGKAGASQAGRSNTAARANPAPSKPAAPRPAASTTPAPRAAADSSARHVARARRQALSVAGKRADQSADRTRASAKGSRAPTVATEAKPEKKGCGCGCKGERREDSATAAQATAPEAPTPSKANGSRRRIPQTSALQAPGRLRSMARRQAQSTRGKAGEDNRSASAASVARRMNPRLSGRDLARAMRGERSRNGGANQPKSAPAGRVRPKPTGGAEDAPWKVGSSETTHGQQVTGTMVGRSPSVTGDEPSTCRTITGTEYLGADIFQSFCKTEPAPTPRKVGKTATTRGGNVTGTEVGRGSRVTGDEPGTCKNVTGTEYIGAGQYQAYCGVEPAPSPAKVSVSESRGGRTVTGAAVGRSPKVTGDEPGAGRELTGTQYQQVGNGKFPQKAPLTSTLRGGSVTGTRVDRSTRVTGDEPGSCRIITGDEYIGMDQYAGFCKTSPPPEAPKVGLSRSFNDRTITGTMTGRSERVTGDEPGTCKAVTGTPYAGVEQYQGFCAPDQQSMATGRSRRLRMTPGPSMTGQQPGINGRLTGAERGACEPVTGTPYVGSDQYAEACAAAPSGSPDFPQSLDGTPWTSFSVLSPARAAHQARQSAGITGTAYEQGHITGPFGMGEGKITGTEQFRFGPSGEQMVPEPETPVEVEGRVKPRITGEGMDTGLRITGDDWDRGERITGTEGPSAVRRNPSRRGGPMMSAMPAFQERKRNEELAEPSSKITGSSGATERGALITVSGGARG